MARLLSNDEDVRYETALEVARTGRPALIVAASLIQSPIERAREMGCHILWNIPDESRTNWTPIRDGIPMLLQVLEFDTSESVRSSAAIAVGNLAVGEAIPLVCQLVVSKSPSVRLDAAMALGSLGSRYLESGRTLRELVVGALLTLTYDSDDDVRDWATFGLHQGEHFEAPVIDRFWRLLDDSYPDVRGEAALGLAHAGDHRFIPRLMDLLRHDVLAPLYFEAAETFADPVLLPAMLEAERRWIEDLEPGETMHSSVLSAVKTLRAAASGVSLE